MEKEELFDFAVKHGIIDFADILEHTTNMKRTEILEQYGEHGTIRKTIWFAEKEGYWYWSKPDNTKKKGYTNVKRRKKVDIENLLCNYYMAKEENEQNTSSTKNITIEELFFKFMEYKKQLVGSGTIKRMMADWKRFYAPNLTFIHKNLQTLTKIDIDEFFNDILIQHTIKDKAFHNMCGILKQSLEYAVDAEYIEKNPYRVNVSKKKIVRSRKKPSTMEVYSYEEKEKLIAEMERRLQRNLTNTAPLAVMLDFELGTRKGEILALCDSDIRNGRIHICKQVVEDFDTTNLNNIKSVGFKAVNYTKSEDGDRWLPLTENAKQIISRVKELNKKNGEHYRNFLFVRDGYLMSPDAIDAQIKRGCKHINIPVKTMHKIRKTYGSTLFNNGVPLSGVKDMLGHADESTTLKYYIYNTMGENETEEQVLSALQGNAKSSKQFVPNVREREQNIIMFPTNKKAENPYKQRILH